jgi:hypothetical protein
MFTPKPKYVVATALILLCLGAFIWLRSHVIERLSASLQQRIESLNVGGLNVHYDSISVNWLTNVIEIDHLLLEKNRYDTTCIYPEFISVAKVRAEGIALLPLIFQKVLSIETLYLDSSRMVLREKSLFHLDSATQRKNEFTLKAERVIMRGADYVYTDSARCKIVTGFKSNMSIANLNIDFRANKPLEYDATAVEFEFSEVKLPEELYTFRIRQIKMDLFNKSFKADSIQVIPDVGKLEFGRRHGFEIDRFEGLVPYIKADGISFAFNDSTRVKASLAEVQFYLKIFRDKRLRFIEKSKLLPIAALRSLPFRLMIDTLKVTKSYVQYEEFAEGASEAGHIFFDKMYAVFENINSEAQTGNTRLVAHASLLGKGDVDVVVTFPLEKSKRAIVKGSIKDFNIPEINSMLTPTTQIKVESGNMKELSFNFSFNTTRSDGEIELNYENLKLITFKDDEKTKNDEPEIDNLKTFIMNTFIFRKNMDENVPEEKRKGTIMYVRDDSRSIFNFWSKSLVSGIKSAYNLDKVEAKQSERQLKKEERLTRREARRKKKAEKKKERG